MPLCLMAEGYPIQSWWWGVPQISPPSRPGWGVPRVPPPSRPGQGGTWGTPHPDLSGGTPHPGTGYTPKPGIEYPITQTSDKVPPTDRPGMRYPPPPRPGMGYLPTHRPGMGYPPPTDMGQGIPPPCKCGQTENITFPHPSDVGGNEVPIAFAISSVTEPTAS